MFKFIIIQWTLIDYEYAPEKLNIRLEYRNYITELRACEEDVIYYKILHNDATSTGHNWNSIFVPFNVECRETANFSIISIRRPSWESHNLNIIEVLQILSTAEFIIFYSDVIYYNILRDDIIWLTIRSLEYRLHCIYEIVMFSWFSGIFCLMRCAFMLVDRYLFLFIVRT